MTATIPAATWQAMNRQLADRLSAAGDLRSRAWRDAVLAIPRHEFVPRYYTQDTTAQPTRWIRHDPDDPDDPDSIARWLDLVYSPTTLITDLAEYADRGIQVPVCSSTKPDLMVRMLEALEITDRATVLEIGTGTGYNAGLVAHRLGDDAVCSVDIDPRLITDARQRLAGLGYHPTLCAGGRRRRTRRAGAVRPNHRHLRGAGGTHRVDPPAPPWWHGPRPRRGPARQWQPGRPAAR